MKLAFTLVSRPSEGCVIPVLQVYTHEDDFGKLVPQIISRDAQKVSQSFQHHISH